RRGDGDRRPRRRRRDRLRPAAAAAAGGGVPRGGGAVRRPRDGRPGAQRAGLRRPRVGLLPDRPHARRDVLLLPGGARLAARGARPALTAGGGEKCAASWWTTARTATSATPPCCRRWWRGCSAPGRGAGYTSSTSPHL